MSAVRVVHVLAAGGCAALLAAAPVAALAQQAQVSSIVGAWTLNKDLSDQPPTSDRGSGGENTGRRGGGYRGGGGFGGGMRGGGRRGGMGGGSTNPEDAQRMREAMRAELTPADQLTIVQSESMILITSQDGRTLRLSPDGKKVKEENTGIERKTKWDGGKLVSEVSGLGRGKITETYSVDPETHRLKMTIEMQGGRGEPRTVNRVYDPAQKDGQPPSSSSS